MVIRYSPLTDAGTFARTDVKLSSALLVKQYLRHHRHFAVTLGKFEAPIHICAANTVVSIAFCNFAYIVKT